MRVSKTTKQRRLVRGFEQLERREMLSVLPVEANLLQTDSYTATQTFQDGAAGYAGTVDTYVRFYAPTTSNGALTSVNADTSDTNGGVAQALLRFDDIFGAGASQIPLDATITSARLVVNVSDASTNTLSFHRMLIPWSETATWNELADGIQADGAEAASAPDATLTPTTTGKWTIDVTPSLAAWVASPAQNYGWAILPGGTDGVDISSRENATAGDRPQLSVTYSSSSAPRAAISTVTCPPTRPAVPPSPGAASRTPLWPRPPRRRSVSSRATTRDSS